MFEKIWARHVVAVGPGGHVLLYIDRHLLHEGSTHAFGRLERAGRRVRRPDLSFATADHYVLTSPGSPAPDTEIKGMIEALTPPTGAKDVILAIIAQIGAGGGVGHAIEYAGSAIRAMSMDERMTVCNMSIEAGARAGMIAPDETTYAFLEGRPFAPRGDRWAQALAD